MKILLIIIGLLILGFLLIQFYSMTSRKKIELYPYQVIKSYAAFEIRKYEARLFTSVKLKADKYENASGKGFSILAGYIFGGNKQKEKIAMTSPVSMSLEDSMTMMFMVPKAWKKEDLPEPNRTDIQFTEEPAKTVAAISFGGWANSEKIKTYKEKLMAALTREGIPFTNQFYFFGYNPPYDIINRKNEIIVTLADDYENTK
jgi:hypothetical protein